jgi:hypothetical protein
MFEIFRNGKKTVRKTFTTYDKARCYARKLMRKQFIDLFAPHNNPQLCAGNYSIRRNPTLFTW